jgi:hypothetical protein
MIIKRETYREYSNRVNNWHRHYSLFPRFIDGAFVWFEWLERKREHSWTEYYWVYRLPKDKE